MIDSSKKRLRLRIIIPAYPAFNIYTHVAKITTALGPVCVASVVNEMSGWDVEIIDENNFRRHGPRDNNGKPDHKLIQSQRPADVVGLYGGLTSTIPRLYEIAKFYKSQGIPVLTGGQHFTQESIEEAFRSGIDYVIIGEAEETIKEFLPALLNKADLSLIKGIAYLKDNCVITTLERSPITDFDSLPLPNFSLVRYANIRLYPIGRIRGCGMDCEFCTVKGKPRCASPERLMEYIKYLVETYDARLFFMVDDLFGQQRQETLRFCEMLKDYQLNIGRKLEIMVQIRLDMAKDSQLLTAMRAACIDSVAIGFESPIKEELKAMKKHITPEEMVALARIYHKFGFLVHGMFIFGYPLRDDQNININAQQRIKYFKNFIRQAKIDTVQILLPVPLPGTELRERLKKQNRVYSSQDVGWEYYDGNFPIFEPDTPLTSQDLQKAAQRIMGKFYQFKYMFLVGLHVVSFPTMIFFLHNIKFGWNKWYREWRNNLIRFGGWIILKGWTKQFKKGNFSDKLIAAQKHLGKIVNS
jgi:radical SAM superfamily enzyme YgiQ (UPF0313 family)